MKTFLLLSVLLIGASCLERAAMYRGGHRESGLPKVGVVHKPMERIPMASLPENLFWGNRSGINYLTVLRNQHIPHYCGACWAFAATSALSDRIKIMRNATFPDINLAPQVLLSCETDDNGCHGGEPFNAYKYISQNGISDETCSIYLAYGLDNGMTCSDEILYEITKTPNLPLRGEKKLSLLIIFLTIYFLQAARTAGQARVAGAKLPTTFTPSVNITPFRAMTWKQ